MQTINLDSWNDFAPAIRKIRKQYGILKDDLGNPDGGRKNQILFRGHASDTWDLSTTLERRTTTKFDIGGYVLRATYHINEIEARTGLRWPAAEYSTLRNHLDSQQDSMDPGLPCYDYLVYLRHHGFPSPLLDWTLSPFVAAFFAYSEARESERVAIYAFIDKTHSGKALTGGRPRIKVQGRLVTTHPRHFSQKAVYTIATEWSNEFRGHVFCPHSSIIPDFNDQDIFIKLTLPNADRVSALVDLSDYNINHYTLFQSDDSLIHSIAINSFELNA